MWKPKASVCRPFCDGARLARTGDLLGAISVKRFVIGSHECVKLASGRWFFLFTTWVPRAMENFQLALTSRILKEEVGLDG
jgi:hypothetical protein